MKSDKEFLDDPIFAGLKKFAATPTKEVDLPSDLVYTLRNSGIRANRQKVIRRSVFTVIAASVVLPSLSYAHVLPAPIDNVVKSVVHLVAAPVRAISNVINDPAPSLPAPSPVAPTPDPVAPTSTPTTSPSGPTNAPVPVPSHSQTTKPITPPKPAAGGGGEDDEEESEGSERGAETKLPSSALPSPSATKPSVSGGGHSQERPEGKRTETEGDDD